MQTTNTELVSYGFLWSCIVWTKQPKMWLMVWTLFRVSEQDDAIVISREKVVILV